MRSACCFYKSRNTHSEYIKNIAFQGKNIFSTVPQYDDYTFVAGLVLWWQIVLLIYINQRNATRNVQMKTF